jgi:diadenosine tetraphosphatase ApaH/serine/threonine PP2A family protein phosphatase
LLSLEDRNECFIKPCPCGFQTLLVVNAAQMGFHFRGWAEGGKEMVGSQVTEKIVPWGGQISFMGDDPFPGQKGQHRVSGPTGIAHFVWVHLHGIGDHGQWASEKGGLTLIREVNSSTFTQFMRVALISDIHSNLEALEAVMRDMRRQKVDDVVCLGDVVGYGADPGPCLDIVRERKWICLLGNHDEAATGAMDLEGYSELAKAGMIYSRRMLNPDQKKWLASRPYKAKAHGVQLVHSSLHEPEEWNYIIDELAAELNFLEQTLWVCFHGHTHVSCVWERHEDGMTLETGPRQRSLNKQSRYLINVGSVGQPRDRNPRACYVIWEPLVQRVVFRRVVYDIEAAQEKIRAAGLPMQLAGRLAQGK